MDLQDRVARLERNNRRLLSVAITLLMGLASVILMGQARTPSQLEAETFVVRDRNGNAVARLGASYSTDYSQSWAGLTFVDPDQQTRTYFSNANNGGTLRLAAPGGGVVYMTAESDGDARIRVFGPDGLNGPVANIRMLPGGQTVSMFLMDGEELRAVMQHSRGQPVFFWTAP